MNSRTLLLLALAATLSVARAASTSQQQASALVDGLLNPSQVQASSVSEKLMPAEVIRRPMLDFINSTPQLSEFASCLKASGLDLTVAKMVKDGTIIAPTNFAFADLFAALNVTSADQIPRPLLAEVLRYHLLPQTIKAADLEDGAVLTTLLQGETIAVEKEGSSITFIPSSGISTSAVLIPDVTAPGSDAVTYIVDGVLLPDLAA